MEPPSLVGRTPGSAAGPLAGLIGEAANVRGGSLRGFPRPHRRNGES
jgi:hypothetical protein